MNRKNALCKAVMDWRNRGLLNSLSEDEFRTLTEDACRKAPVPWTKILLFCGIACFFAGIAALCHGGGTSPRFCAVFLFLVSVALRVRFRKCEGTVQKLFVTAVCCMSMIGASYYLGKCVGHDGPWLLLAGLFCAFIPHGFAAFFAVVAMGFGLCLLPGKLIPVYEFRIMLFAFPAAALAFAGKIPSRFRQPGMLKGLGAVCHYILKGHFAYPDLLVLAGVGVAAFLFWLSRKTGIRPLRVWGCLWGLAMAICWAFLHLDGNAAVAATFEILAASAFFLLWRLHKKRTA